MHIGYRILLAVFYIVVLDTNTVTTSFTKRQIQPETSQCAGPAFFQCTSGECVAKDKLCDAKVDCKDKLDETEQVCQALYKGRCRRGQWRCAYGACIQVAQRCDLTGDCWDGSDEADCPHLTTSTEMTSSASGAEPTPTTESQQLLTRHKPCKVPEANYTLFHTWSRDLGTCERVQPGALIPNNDLLLVSCDSERNFRLERGRQSYSICKEGEWSHKIPKCIVCGISSLNRHGVDGITSGHVALQEDFPWHAGVYYWSDNQWIISGAGTLISPRVVLTAAHVVSYKSSEVKVPDPVALEDLSVSLGKHCCNWNVMEDAEQRFVVKESVLYPDYRIGPGITSGNIALLLLDGPVDISPRVMPACVDYTNTFAMEVAENKSLLGYVAGWNITWTDHECASKKGNDPVLYSHLPVLSRQTLYNIVLATKKSAASEIFEDLFSLSNGTETAFMGDIGGGLTIPFQDLHYVFGIFASPFYLNRVTYGALINVSHHTEWIENQMDKWSER